MRNKKLDFINENSKAIPVEWIAKYLFSHYICDEEDGYCCEWDELDDGYFAIRWMVEAWEKENS